MPFELDLPSLDAAICEAHERAGRDDGTVSAAVLAELAAQIRPHVPGAQEGERLEELVNRVLMLLEGALPGYRVCRGCTKPGDIRYVRAELVCRVCGEPPTIPGGRT